MRITLVALILLALLSKQNRAAEVKLEGGESNGRVGTEFYLSPDGKSVVRVLLNQGASKVDHWDAETGETLPGGITRYTATGVSGCVAISPNNRLLALGSFSQGIELLKLETFETVHRIELSAYALALKFDDEGKNLFYLEEDGTLWRCGIASNYQSDRIAKFDINESKSHAIEVSGNSVLITYRDKQRRVVARLFRLPL